MLRRRMIAIPPELIRILNETPELGRSFLVGGCVRDALLGIPHKDFDIEVFGVSYEHLAQALARWGKTDLVGRSFGVVKLRAGEFVFDFTIPRRDSKIAPGHKGFEISFESDISPKDAASRRDYTINALMFDPRTGGILDFFGGVDDLKARRLRHTSDAFVEDPLRVLRGMQFASRFRLEPAPETIELCRQIKASYAELPVERVREEWFKWASQSEVPSIGLRFLVSTRWIEHFPELRACMGTPQDKLWHPEGDVFVHTCHCCDAMAQLPQWKSADMESRIVLMLTILTHDFGKPTTTFERTEHGKSRIVSPGHESAGVPIAEKFLKRIGTPVTLREKVLPMVGNHMIHYQTTTDRAVRRLAHRLHPATIEELCLVMTADRMGRPPLPPSVPKGAQELLTRARDLQLESAAPKPILLGRHLIGLGMQPSPEFGSILRAAFDAQLEGAFFSLAEAFQWLSARTHLQLPANVRERLKLMC